MARTVAELKSDVLDLLQKNPAYSGFYTDDKVLRALQDSIDYCAAHMIEAASGNWFDRIVYLTTTSTQQLVPLPTDVAMIKSVRYLVANQYVPLMYDAGYEDRQFSQNSGVVQYPSKYRLVQGGLYFNPGLGIAGKDYIMLEYASYPDVIIGDSPSLQPQWERALQHYCKYRAASILVSSIGKFNKEWDRYENEWFERMIVVVNKKVNSPQYIREFEG